MVLATCTFKIFQLLGKSYALVTTYFKCLNLINTLPLYITQITMNLGATFKKSLRGSFDSCDFF